MILACLVCKHVTTPIDPKNRLSEEAGAHLSYVGACGRLVGCLLYLTTTRSHATQQFSQFMAHSTEPHHKAAIRVLCDLKRAPGFGFYFSHSSSLQLLDFSDVDLGGCVDHRCSISGYCFFFLEIHVCWRSPKQHTLAIILIGRISWLGYSHLWASVAYLSPSWSPHILYL